MLYGLGAGMMPTASAVVSDAVQIAKNIHHNNTHSSIPKFFQDTPTSKTTLLDPGDLVSRFYVRFQLEDTPGELGRVANILGKNHVGIESVIQKGRHHGGGDVPVVIMTHDIVEKNLLAALAEIEKLEISKGKNVFLRIVDV